MSLDKPIKYHGGKFYLAKRIIELMPPHLHYVEPYFGGGAVLLEKDPEGVSEVVNDINRELTNFWSVLKDREQFRWFQREVEATPFSQPTFEAAEYEDAMELATAEEIERAYRFFIRARQSRQGLMKDFATLSRNRVRRGMNEQASSWLTAIEGLPEVHARLKRVVILNQDALEVIKSQDGANTLFYLDPPYLHETRESKDAYAHEMSAQDHAKLLLALDEIEGKFILSGYPSRLYNNHAETRGWHRVDIEIDNKASSKAVKDMKTECLWMNFKPKA